MKLAVMLPYAEGAMTPAEMGEFAHVADRLGYESIWVPEAWSFDAFVILTSLIPHTDRIGLATGIANIYSRSPAMLAQSAASLDFLSGGRAILGLGTSGPQVIEGWHGVPFSKPLQRTRETIEIVRMILRREKLRYEGKVFNLSMGLKLINHPIRDAIPIGVASLGPRNVELTAELADIWLPTMYSPARAKQTFGPAVDAGLAKRSPDLGPLDVAPQVTVCITDTPDPARTMVKFGLALYIGGMGSREQNFYNRIVRQYGFEDAAEEIQNLYLDRKRQEAVAAVPDALVDELSVIGPAGYVKDRFAEYAEAGATTLMLSLVAPDQAGRLTMLEELIALA
jgi:F420-dependent oxidoreductase-like protein